MKDPREEDVQKLCISILKTEASHREDYSGRDHYNCPICMVSGDDYDLSLFKHHQDCGYLIAKDLSAGVAS